MTDHPRPATGKTLKHKPHNKAVTQRSRAIKIQELQPEVGAAQTMAHLSTGIEPARDNPAADNSPNGMTRRRIEMYREEQLLRRQLLDSYDP